MEYMTVNEAGKKWGISGRRVAILCEQGRIDGAAKLGKVWAVPKGTQKPTDARIKTGKYIKNKPDENKGG